MKKLSRMDLNDQVLSRDEMKTIMAGSGGYACTYVVNMDTGWTGTLDKCETVVNNSPTYGGSATLEISRGGAGGGATFTYESGSTTTIEEICTYTTHDPYNIGHEEKTVHLNGAAVRQC